VFFKRKPSEFELKKIQTEEATAELARRLSDLLDAAGVEAGDWRTLVGRADLGSIAACLSVLLPCVASLSARIKELEANQFSLPDLRGREPTPNQING
jgi:ubiquinone biosynthesis protein UbiJ